MPVSMTMSIERMSRRLFLTRGAGAAREEEPAAHTFDGQGHRNLLFRYGCLATTRSYKLVPFLSKILLGLAFWVALHQQVPYKSSGRSIPKHSLAPRGSSANRKVIQKRGSGK